MSVESTASEVTWVPPAGGRQTALSTPAELPHRAEPSGRELPYWFRLGLVIAVAGVLSFGTAGLALAILGGYSFPAALPFGVVGTVCLTYLARPRQRVRGANALASTLPAIGMCVIAIGLMVWNGKHDSRHPAVDIDAGGYSVTAKWVEAHGSLVVQAGRDWPVGAPDLKFDSPGVYRQPNGELQFQFQHFLPVLMAEAGSVGGDRAMFGTVAILGSLALCMVYAVGCRLVRRHWIVLAAVTGLGLSLPQIWVSRDPYSETSTQFVLWAAVYLLITAVERRRVSVGVLAGCALGATTMTRIDAATYLMALPLLLCGAWLARPQRSDRTFLLRLALAVTGPALFMVAIGTIDLLARSVGYYNVLRLQVRDLWVAFVVLAVLSAGLAALGGRLGPARSWVRARRSRLASLTFAATATGLLLSWLVRPHIQKQLVASVANPVVKYAQAAEGLPVEPMRAYGEQSLHWFSWYLGPGALLLAIFGAALMMAVLIYRPPAAVFLTLGVTGICTCLYLWNPEITPIQIYVMRRYVPAVLPLAVLAAAYGMNSLLNAIGVAPPVLARSARPVVAVLGSVILILPVTASWQSRDFRVQAGYDSVVVDTCRAVGTNAAVLIVSAPTPGDVESMLPQTLRSWCNVPVAILTQEATAQRIADLAADVGKQGRVLWLVGDSAAVIKAKVPTAIPSLVDQVSNDKQLAWRLSQRAGGYVSQSLQIYAARA